MRHWLILLWLVFSPAALAVSFDEHLSKLPLGREIAVFEDVRGNASIEEVSSSVLADSFRPHQEDILNAGYSHSAFWLRLDLDYRPRRAQEAANWLLELAFPPLDKLDLYLPDGQGGYRLAQRTGDTLPFSSRAIHQSHFLFELKLQPDQPQRIYLRLESRGSMQVPLTLWSPKAYLEVQTERAYLLGSIYGLLLVLLVYNLFNCFIQRDASYLYYVLYAAALGLYHLSVNGMGLEFLWPDSPWWANVVSPFMIGATALFGCQFARRFLQTAEHSRPMDWLLRLCMAAGAVLMLLTLFISYSISVRLATCLAVSCNLLVFSAGLFAWLRGLRAARYFVLAWSLMLLGGLTNSLTLLGLLPSSLLGINAGQIGFTLGVGLLSLALAARIGIIKDERTRALQDTRHRLEQLNLELANSNRLKDDFLATVTHELRTPMSGVIGSLELMQTVPMEVELAHYHKNASDAARDMMRMVNDILALIELRAGKLYPRCEPFSLRGLCDGLRAQYAPRAQERNLQFTLQLKESLPDTLEGDASKLTHALGYLLDNAIKFTHQGGVSLHVSGTPNAQGLLLLMEVRDSGIGFAAPPGGAIYQGFYQLDGSSTREYGGLGVGLALCRKLVALLGGELSHHSSLGQGSCFSLSLQLGQPTCSQTPPPRRAGGQAQRGPEQCTVLVVDDNPINQLVIRGMLLKLGYRVRTADSGLEALKLLRRVPIDALLLDCQMPGMDGFATCRAIRELPHCAELPILAISDYPHAGERERYLAAGMNDYLAKPVKFQELQTLLHDWLLCQPGRASDQN